MAEPYIPPRKPFWSDGVFQVHEITDGHFVASRVKGVVHFRGDLRSCAQWVEKERRLDARKPRQA